MSVIVALHDGVLTVTAKNGGALLVRKSKEIETRLALSSESALLLISSLANSLREAK